MYPRSGPAKVVPISIYNSDDGKRWYAYVIGRDELWGRGKSPSEAIKKLEKRAQNSYDEPIELKVRVENVVFPDLITLQEYGEWAHIREHHS